MLNPNPKIHKSSNKTDPNIPFCSCNNSKIQHIHVLIHPKGYSIQQEKSNFGGETWKEKLWVSELTRDGWRGTVYLQDSRMSHKLLTPIVVMENERLFYKFERDNFRVSNLKRLIQKYTQMCNVSSSPFLPLSFFMFQ